MRILVTGGCGFLGSNISAYEQSLGHEIIVFDNLSRKGSELNRQWLESKGNIRVVIGDTRKQDQVDALFQQYKFDGVFHLAGQVAMTTSISNPRLDFETNTMGTFNVLDAIRRIQPNTPLIYSSTNKVYGDLEQYEYIENETRYICPDHPNGFDEKTPLDMHSPYGVSKGAADQYVLDFARIFGLKTAVFRHSSMFGGRQFASYDQGWIGWFCAKAHERRRHPAAPAFTICGNGKQVRDVLHADDIVRLYERALVNIDRISGEAFNIGGGMNNSLSLLELFAILEKKLDVHLEYTKLAPRISDQKIFVADTAKIRSRIDWDIQVNTNDGINAALEWAEKIMEID